MLTLETGRSLRQHNSLAIDVKAEFFCRITTVEQLQEAIRYANQHCYPITILGGGTNVVLTKHMAGLVIAIAIPGLRLDEQTDDRRLMTVGAGENWHKLVEITLANRWFGLENLALIPGMAGAAPIQNIGAYGVELKDRFVALKAVDLNSGEVIRMDAADCQFGYRDSIFKHRYRDRFAICDIQLTLSTEAALRIEYPALQSALRETEDITPELVAETVCAIRRSKLPDPEKAPNVGSFFKNPVISSKQAEEIRCKFPALVSYSQPGNEEKLAAGWLIEQCGWKGFRRGNVGVHEHQALVLVNNGGSGLELLELAADISASVKERYGVSLEIEPRVYL
ncbi:MAG: UDP-N-acetylmuramate dehydrogenase [Pseudomonadales bacterium]|nr:UDP-N-acetylmuramate dehydrogenase [Pseudomonadales bacterium]MCP5171758.1 UDP-N-acetylmuramate dehydrogenase [Pseudomonadales bacterium]